MIIIVVSPVVDTIIIVSVMVGTVIFQKDRMLKSLTRLSAHVAIYIFVLMLLLV